MRAYSLVKEQIFSKCCSSLKQRQVMVGGGGGSLELGHWAGGWVGGLGSIVSVVVGFTHTHLRVHRER